jgi:hypothetical protein
MANPYVSQVPDPGLTMLPVGPTKAFEITEQASATHIKIVAPNLSVDALKTIVLTALSKGEKVVIDVSQVNSSLNIVLAQICSLRSKTSDASSQICVGIELKIGTHQATKIERLRLHKLFAISQVEEQRSSSTSDSATSRPSFGGLHVPSPSRQSSIPGRRFDTPAAEYSKIALIKGERASEIIPNCDIFDNDDSRQALSNYVNELPAEIHYRLNLSSLSPKSWQAAYNTLAVIVTQRSKKNATALEIVVPKGTLEKLINHFKQLPQESFRLTESA